MSDAYGAVEPSREEIDALKGPAVLEFGTSWCGHCRAAQPHIAAALADHPAVCHLKIAYASGRRLGRSFGIKLWPTLVFLKHGKEVTRLIRPTRASVIRDALALIETKP